MFDVVIETKAGDLIKKGVSWHTRNSLIDRYVSFKFDDFLLLFDPSVETEDDQNDSDDWSCNKEEELDDVEFSGNKYGVPYFCNHTFL
jgi:hypothetical protein